MMQTSPLTLDQLERHLYAATDILRSKVDGTAYQEYFFCLLFLKRCSDLFEEYQEQARNEQGAPGHGQHADILAVPLEARWSFLCSHAAEEGNAARLDQALVSLERANPSLQGTLGHLCFSRPGKARLTEQTLRDLLSHFSRYRLRDSDLEFPDLLGAAYEYLLADFADSAGKRAGEFYSPRDVLDVMVRILEPMAGMSIYDPCAGSGGALILALQHMLEIGGRPQDLHLYGQELNSATWALSKMNALIHGNPGADIRNADTLASPQHVVGNELMRFNRIISNPPYSQNYNRAELTFPQRFHYGFCPETGKRGDLMFIQHMLAVLEQDGMMATVVPHGVLFRGGAEQAIRRGFVEDDVLEAIIGLPPNLFYGTSIPTCILIMRPSGSKPPERRGKVLFINADADYEARRAQNRLSPEHRERIVGTFHAWISVPGYAVVMKNTELAANEFNLNIRGYVDNSPPLEPQDVRAHLLGGVPKSEVEDLEAHLCRYGVESRSFFHSRSPDDGYLDFQKDLTERSQIKKVIEEHEGIRSKEALLLDACQQWWCWWSNSDQLLSLLLAQHMQGIRDMLLRSFVATLSPLEVLDSDKLRGIFAIWWERSYYDLKTLATKGFHGLIGTWLEKCATAVSGHAGAWQRGAQEGTVSQKLLRHLLPSYLENLTEINAAIAGIEDQLAEAKQSEEDEDEEVSDLIAQARLKKALVRQKSARTTLLGELESRLEEARADLSEVSCRQMVLDLWLSDLLTLIEQRVAGQRWQIASSIEHLWDKYRISLREIEADRQRAEERVDAMLKKLGYVDV